MRHGVITVSGTSYAGSVRPQVVEQVSVLLAMEDRDVTRTYKNSAGDILRIDTVTLVTLEPVYERRQTRYQHGFLDRTVASIEIITNADSIDTGSWPSGNSNYTWVTWTDIDYTCDMSDLPQIGDAV